MVDHPLSMNLIFFFFISIVKLITREQFEDALKIIQDESIIVVMGKTTIRICKSTD